MLSNLRDRIDALPAGERVIFDAIYRGRDRDVWLDPEDALEMTEDVVAAQKEA